MRIIRSCREGAGECVYLVKTSIDGNMKANSVNKKRQDYWLKRLGHRDRNDAAELSVQVVIRMLRKTCGKSAVNCSEQPDCSVRDEPNRCEVAYQAQSKFTGVFELRCEVGRGSRKVLLS